MNDPAVLAARRAFGNLWPDQGDFEFNFDSSTRQYAVDAAREALKPLRELHHRYTVKATSCAGGDCCPHQGDCPMDVDVPVCWECYRFASDDVYPYFEEENLQAVEWPCVTARLIYAEGEL